MRVNHQHETNNLASNSGLFGCALSAQNCAPISPEKNAKLHDEDYRRRILTQLNRGESRHAVARAICHGQKGEIRKRYTDGQEDQLGTLGLVTNAVVLWNTIYMQAALDHLRAQGETLNDEDIARLSPLCHGHINMLGHYSFTLAELVTKGHLRPLKEASEAENVA